MNPVIHVTRIIESEIRSISGSKPG